MPSTFSNLGLELQATGENANTWGQKTNVGLQRVDNAIAGFTTVQANSTTITLAFSTNSGSTTFTDENGRNKILKFTSGTAAAAITVTVPDIEKEYLVRNETGQNVTFSAGGATTVTIATGKNAHIYIDGASAVYNALADAVTTSLDTGAITTTGITTTGNINFGDNDKAQFGASQDLQVFHDGSNSYIIDNGTGNLIIRGVNLDFQSTSGEDYINCTNNGGVTLRYDTAGKLNTTSTGVNVTGTVVSDGADLDGAVVINESGAAVDFRVESDTNTHALFVDASTNNVLIGTTDNSPAESSVNDGLRLGTNGGTQIGTNGITVLTLNRNTNDGIHIDIRRQGSRIGYIGTNTSNLGLGTGDVGVLFDDALDAILPANPDSSLGSRNNAIDLGTASAAFRRIYLGSAAVIQEQTLTDGATIAWDVSAKAVAKVTLGGNRTLSAPNSPIGTGQFISLLVIQDGTGSRTLTWNAAYEFKDDTAPTLTTTASKADLFVFRYNGTKWLEVGRNTNLSIS